MCSQLVLLPCIACLIGGAGETLPASWHGDWRGTLAVLSQKGSAAIDMELSIHPIEDSARLAWRIVYEEKGTRQVRPYELLPVEKRPGRFVIDEKNGVLIDARLVGDVLYSQFKLNDTLIAARYERLGEALRVEIVSFRLNMPRVSKLEASKVEVQSFEMIGSQTGTLKRGVKKADAP